MRFELTEPKWYMQMSKINKELYPKYACKIKFSSEKIIV